MTTKYITVETFTKKDARKWIEHFEWWAEMDDAHGSPEEEIEELKEKVRLLKLYWKLRWNEEYHDRSEYGLYRELGPLVE